MTIYVVRHAEARDDEITDKWIEQSIEKWRDFRLITEWVKDEILILTSPKNRAKQTAENIKIWLENEAIDIKELQSLSDEDFNANLSIIIEIMKLRRYQILILITHANYMYRVAKTLGYDRWPFPHEKYLEDYEIDPEQYEPLLKKYII